MSAAPLVSVVLPAKDQAPYIDEALVSLENQFQDPSALEVVVVDDGSEDGTGEIAARHSGRLPRLKVLRNEEARGLASARNQGLAETTADVIGYMDGDDWLARGHLAESLRVLTELDVDFVRCDHTRVTRGNRVLARAPQARRNVALDPREGIMPETTSTMVDYPYAWAGLFQRRVADRGLLEFPEGLHTAEDRPWIWRLFLQAESYAVTNAPGVMYRRGVSTSLTQIYDRRQLDFGRSYMQTFDVLEADEEAEVFWPKLARQFLAIAAHHRGRRSAMTPQVRREQADLIRAGLERIPRDVLEATVRQLDLARRRRLAPLMPAGMRLKAVAS